MFNTVSPKSMCQAHNGCSIIISWINGKATAWELTLTWFEYPKYHGGERGNMGEHPCKNDNMKPDQEW